jgi:hypothetical protein
MKKVGQAKLWKEITSLLPKCQLCRSLIYHGGHLHIILPWTAAPSPHKATKGLSRNTTNLCESALKKKKRWQTVLSNQNLVKQAPDRYIFLGEGHI